MQSCAFLPLPSSSPREHAGAGLRLTRDPEIYVRRTFWAGPKEQPVQRPEGRSLPGVLERDGRLALQPREGGTASGRPRGQSTEDFADPCETRAFSFVKMRS